jgi:O-succinylbenzoate synthase
VTVRLDAVELFVVRLPLVRSFETSFGRLDARQFVLVKAMAGGACGWGECVADAHPFYSAETTTTAWHVLADYLIPAALADSVAEPSDLHARWRAVRGHRMAKAALEMAVWDLAARLRGMPLHQMLGGQRRPIASGVSVGIQASPEQLVERVAEELAAGYQRVKIKIKPGWDRAPVEALRRRFDAVPLMVDANAAYEESDAAVFAALDTYRLMMIEQPLGPGDLLRHARLQASLATPLCLDESIPGPDAASDALDLKACRILNIKPGRMGGLGPSLAVHAIAHARGVPLWHGGMLESGIGRAHNLHLSTLPGFTLPGDVAASRRYFDPDLIAAPIDVRPDGTIEIPAGAGIGVDPDPARLTEAAQQTERFTA